MDKLYVVGLAGGGKCIEAGPFHPNGAEQLAHQLALQGVYDRVYVVEASSELLSQGVPVTA